MTLHDLYNLPDDDPKQDICPTCRCLSCDGCEPEAEEEIAMADFPQIELPELAASVDIDWNGHGIYTLVTPMECPCCGTSVKHCGASASRLGEFILTCKNCLHELGILEEF